MNTIFDKTFETDAAAAVDTKWSTRAVDARCFTYAVGAKSFSCTDDTKRFAYGAPEIHIVSFADCADVAAESISCDHDEYSC